MLPGQLGATPGHAAGYAEDPPVLGLVWFQARF